MFVKVAIPPSLHFSTLRVTHSSRFLSAQFSRSSEAENEKYCVIVRIITASSAQINSEVFIFLLEMFYNFIGFNHSELVSTVNS